MCLLLSPWNYKRFFYYWSYWESPISIIFVSLFTLSRPKNWHDTTSLPCFSFPPFSFPFLSRIIGKFSVSTRKFFPSQASFKISQSQMGYPPPRKKKSATWEYSSWKKPCKYTFLSAISPFYRLTTAIGTLRLVISFKDEMLSLSRLGEEEELYWCLVCRVMECKVGHPSRHRTAAIAPPATPLQAKSFLTHKVRLCVWETLLKTVRLLLDLGSALSAGPMSARQPARAEQ